MVRINDGSVNFNIYLLLHIAIFVGFETNHNYIYKTKNDEFMCMIKLIKCNEIV